MLFTDQSKVFLAPMAGITDKPMRQIVHQIAPNVALTTEMVAVNAISYKNPKTYKMADVHDEPYPVVVQLMGSDPLLFENAAKLVTDLGAKGIDINMGCPVRKVVASHSGSFLMTDPTLASKIIETTVKATSLPVSVKFRKGFDAEHINALEFAKMCETSGASYITVHGRTKTQGYTGTADWNILKTIKENIHIPLIGNGDIKDVESAKQMIETTGVDAVMVGRASLGNPWLLRDIARAFDNKPPLDAPLISEIETVLIAHIAALKNYYGDAVALGLTRKYICWYSKTLKDAKKFRENYMKITDFDKALMAVQEYFKILKGA